MLKKIKLLTANNIVIGNIVSGPSKPEMKKPNTLNLNSTSKPYMRSSNMYRKEAIKTLREISKMCQARTEPPCLFYQAQENQISLLNESNNSTSHETGKEETVKCLKYLKVLFEEETRLEYELRADLDEIDKLYNGNLGLEKPYNKFVLGYGIACEFITLTGINDQGLTVLIGSNIERGMDPGLFADALQEEMNLFSYAFKEPTEKDLGDICFLCQKALQREFEKYFIINTEIIAALRRMASELHANKKAVGIAKTFGGSVSTAGGIALGVGIILEIATLGAATPVLIAGASVATVGGVVNVGTGITDAVVQNNILKRNEEQKESMILKTMTNLMELVESFLKPIVDADENSQISTIDREEMKLSGGGITQILSTGFVVAGGLRSVSTQSAVEVMQVMKQTFRFGAAGLAGVGIAFDLLALLDSGTALAMGSKSELGYKLAIDAEELENVLMKRRSMIEQIISE